MPFNSTIISAESNLQLLRNIKKYIESLSIAGLNDTSHIEENDLYRSYIAYSYKDSGFVINLNTSSNCILVNVKNTPDYYSSANITSIRYDGSGLYTYNVLLHAYWSENLALFGMTESTYSGSEYIPYNFGFAKSKSHVTGEEKIYATNGPYVYQSVDDNLKSFRISGSHFSVAESSASHALLSPTFLFTADSRLMMEEFTGIYRISALRIGIGTMVKLNGARYIIANDNTAIKI